MELHSLELSRHPEHAGQYQAMAAQLGQEAAYVPALLFCGELHVGWDGSTTTGAEIVRRLDECRARVLAGGPVVNRAAGGLTVPLLGEVDPRHFFLLLLTIAIVVTWIAARLTRKRDA